MRLVEDTGAVAIPQPHTYVAVADDKRCMTDDTNRIRVQHNMHNAGRKWCAVGSIGRPSPAQRFNSASEKHHKMAYIEMIGPSCVLTSIREVFC